MSGSEFQRNGMFIVHHVTKSVSSPAGRHLPRSSHGDSMSLPTELRMVFGLVLVSINMAPLPGLGPADTFQTSKSSSVTFVSNVEFNVPPVAEWE